MQPLRLKGAALKMCWKCSVDLLLEWQEGTRSSSRPWDIGGRLLAHTEKVNIALDITHTQVAYFVNSGSEANDMAMMIARLYSGNYDLLTLRNGYHGTSPSTMGLLSHSTWKFNTPQVAEAGAGLQLRCHAAQCAVLHTSAAKAKPSCLSCTHPTCAARWILCLVAEGFASGLWCCCGRSVPDKS